MGAIEAARCGVMRPRHAWGGCVRHRIVTIEFGLDILLAFNFNEDRFLCVLFWVHNGWSLSAGDVLLGGLSII